MKHGTSRTTTLKNETVLTEKQPFHIFEVENISTTKTAPKAYLRATRTSKFLDNKHQNKLQPPQPNLQNATKH